MTANIFEKAIEVLNSNHIQSVEVGLDEETDGIRWYSAVTRDSGETHRYTVRLQSWMEGNEFVREIKCNCATGAKAKLCRHAIAVGQEDSLKYGGQPYLEALVNYKAHLATSKCSVCKVSDIVKDGKCRPCLNNASTPYFPQQLNKPVERRKIGNVWV